MSSSPDLFGGSQPAKPLSSPAAEAYLEKMERRLREVPDFPEAGRQVPEFPDWPFREVLVPPNRLFYRVRDGQLWVVGVWHDAQLPTEPPVD